MWDGRVSERASSADLSWLQSVGCDRPTPSPTATTPHGSRQRAASPLSNLNLFEGTTDGQLARQQHQAEVDRIAQIHADQQFAMRLQQQGWG